MTVMMNVLESATVCWRPLIVLRNNPNRLDPDGFSQVVKRKEVKRTACSDRRPSEKFLDRKISSPTNLQLTVHLNVNCLVSSNARETYPTGSA